MWWVVGGRWWWWWCKVIFMSNPTFVMLGWVELWLSWGCDNSHLCSTKNKFLFAAMNSSRSDLSYHRLSNSDHCTHDCNFFLIQNFFWIKYFFTPKFFGLLIFFFISKIFLDQKFYLINTFFSIKIFLGPKVFFWAWHYF